MKLKGLYIIAGHSEKAQGAKAYNGVYEHFYTKLVQLELSVLCKKHKIPYFVDSETMKLSEVVNWVNNTIKDGWHIVDIHFNYNHPKATGCEVFINPSTTESNKQIASRIVHNFYNEFGYKIRRIEPNRDYKYPSESARGRLAMFEKILIEQTKPPVILPEICFLNKKDLDRFDAKRAAECILSAYLTPIRNFKTYDYE